MSQRHLYLKLNWFLKDPSLIASKPSAIRHESRLMIVRNSVLEEDCLTNKFTKNLLDEFREGDLVVVNNTKVMKARLIRKIPWMCLVMFGKASEKVKNK